MKIGTNLKNLSKGVKASIAFFFSSLVTTGIAYISTPLYTRLLSATEYGKTSVFLTWLQIFGIIAMFCLSYGVFNNGMIDYPERRDEYSFSMLGLSNIITITFSLLLLLAYPLVKDTLGLDLKCLALMIVIFITQPAYNFWVARQRYEYKYKLTVLWAVISAVISPIIALTCIVIFPENRYYGRLFGAEIPLILMYIAFYIYLARKSKYTMDKSFWKGALIFNLPLIPHYLSTYLLGNADKLMISNMVNDSATAFYSVAYSVAQVAIIVWNAINASLVPYTYEKCKEKNYQAIDRITKPILLMFAGICLLVIMLAPEVVKVMATTDYFEAVYVIPPVVGGVFFQVQYFIYANIVYYHKKPQYVMSASITATILNIVLNYIYIRKYGYFAAGYTTLFCYLIQACIDFVAMKKVVKSNVYDMKFIIVLSAFVVAVALVSNLIYDYPLIRYTIVFALVVFVILFRNRILGTIKIFKKSK